MTKYVYLIIGIIITVSQFAIAAPEETHDPSNDLLREIVRERVLVNNLELKALEWDIQSKEALVRQSKTWKNPEFEVEAENVLGTGTNKGFDNAETTYKFSEEFELWGKRGMRFQSSKLELALSKNRYRQFKLNLLKSLDSLFAQVVSAQEKVDFAKEKVQLNEALITEIKRLVKAGRFSSVEEKRARIRLSKSRLTEKILEKELLILKYQLSLLWGDEFHLFKAAMKTEFNPEKEDTTSLNVLKEQLASSPEMERLQMEKQVVNLHLKADKSEALPNPTLFGGIKDYQGDRSQTWVLGAAFPIPIFDRNVGHISSAKANLEKKNKEIHAAKLSLSLQLTDLFYQKNLTITHLVSFKTMLIPDAQDVYNDVRQGYLKGRYSYLDLFDAQDSLFEIKENYAEAVADFHRIGAEIWALIGNEVQLKGKTL
ncbi:MAG: TolC family protein [Candidatus Margulisbacteria bacterium]|nr:TolC family protein [Candidatus Margulisiibacteriota bacterium]